MLSFVRSSRLRVTTFAVLLILVTSGQAFAGISPLKQRTNFFRAKKEYFNPRKLGAITTRITTATYEYEARRLLLEMQTRQVDGRLTPSVASRVQLVSRRSQALLISGRYSKAVEVALVANSRLPGADVVRTREFDFSFDPLTARLLMRYVRLATPQAAAIAGIPYIARSRSR